MAEEKNLQNIGIYTVDEFQGNEAHVTIICTTVYGTDVPSFTAQKRRMCVSLSRAKERLVVFGNLAVMRDNVRWKKILKSFQVVNSSTKEKVL